MLTLYAMKEKKFIAELKRCCTDERTTLEDLMRLLLLEDLEQYHFDIDVADYCITFCKHHKGCEFAHGPIHRFIKRTDEMGKVDYLTYREKGSWKIESE